MTNSTSNLSALEHMIISYLTEHGPAYCLTIATDLDQDPRLIQNTLWNLQDQGRTKFLGHTIFHQICPPAST